MSERRDRLCGPKNKYNSGPTNHLSDTLIVLEEDLPELAYYTPQKNGVFGSYGENELVVRTMRDKGEEYDKGTSVIKFVMPTTKKPPLSPIIVEHGGLRSYGGGTSKDAIRRARRKAKRRNSKRK